MGIILMNIRDRLSQVDTDKSEISSDTGTTQKEKQNINKEDQTLIPSKDEASPEISKPKISQKPNITHSPNVTQTPKRSSNILTPTSNEKAQKVIKLSESFISDNAISPNTNNIDASCQSNS